MNNIRRPFIRRALNDIEDLSLMTSLISIYCGLFFISSMSPTSSSFNSNQDFYLNNTGQLILFAVILMSNVMFFLVWIIKFLTVMRSLIKERYSKIYVCLFLCCRQDKFDKENEKLAMEAKRETIIEKIEEV
jgi:hypothetical protein